MADDLPDAPWASGGDSLPDAPWASPDTSILDRMYQGAKSSLASSAGAINAGLNPFSQSHQDSLKEGRFQVC